jgi:hypothetical protein
MRHVRTRIKMLFIKTGGGIPILIKTMKKEATRKYKHQLGSETEEPFRMETGDSYESYRKVTIS